MLLFVACGGAQKPGAKAATTPLTAEQLQAFDRGVDFVATLEGLEGRWREDWDRDLATRVGTADLVALVKVRTLRTDSDPPQRVTYRVGAELTEVMVGSERGKEVELVVRADELGFTSVDENAARLVDQDFVLYLKDGAEYPHWHLSPASEQILLETRSKITQLNRAPKKATGERVIVHTN